MNLRFSNIPRRVFSKLIIGIFLLAIFSCKKFNNQCNGALNERKWHENVDGKCLYERDLLFYWRASDTADFTDEGVNSITILIDSDTMAKDLLIADYDVSNPVNGCFDPNWITASKIVYPQYEHYLQVFDQNDNVIITRILDLEDDCQSIRLYHF